MKRERRAWERHSIPIMATLDTFDGRSLTLRMSNVSFGGAFLKKTDPATPLPSIGTEVRVTIRSQSECGVEAETMAARVVRTRPDGIGVAFLRDGTGQMVA